MTFPAHPPTLCHCGRHKDRCRCAGRHEAFAEAVELAEWTHAPFTARLIRAHAAGNTSALAVKRHLDAIANGDP